MIEFNRYIHQSWSSVDTFFRNDNWLYRIRINDYQLVTIFWNLFLVIIPWVIGLVIFKLGRRTGFVSLPSKLAFAVLALLWLLFIPNTIYIVSDVRHLLNYCPIDSPFQVCEKNAWMILFFFTYAAIGWWSYVFLINQMKSFLSEMYGRIVAELWLLALLPVVAIGFLFGLVHRWNSWEFFIYPKAIYENLAIYLNDPKSFTNWLIFTIFLYVLYWGGNIVFKKMEN